MEDWWKFLKEYFTTLDPTKKHQMMKNWNTNYYKGNSSQPSKKDQVIDLVYTNLGQNENATNEGFKDGLWYPFRSKNGNYEVYKGIDLDKHPEYKEEALKGLTDQRGMEIAKEILGNSYDDAFKSVSRYTDRPDTISNNMLGGLTDLGYQSGSVYSGYPKLSRAIAEGNYPEILNQHEVWFEKKGNWDSSKRITKVKNGKTYVLDENRINNRNKQYFHY